MSIWQFLSTQLQQGNACVLLIVVESIGSSPGRQGFKMALTERGLMNGSIGGGIMEHKLVVLGKSLLEKALDKPIIKRQVHNKSNKNHQSGMICSGEQTIALVPLMPSQLSLIQRIEQHQVDYKSTALLHIDVQGLKLKTETDTSLPFYSDQLDTPNWFYTEQLSQQKTIHIIGAGHVGLALSKQMALLGFRVRIYDNRLELNTMVNNEAAHEKIVLDYSTIEEYVTEGPDQFLVIMTFGYRDDKMVLIRLYKKQFAYIGLMGSQEKIRQLYLELEQEGISHEMISHIHSPIGIQIGSKTPEEIAVSIAAEIIGLKNK